ncbi:MAG: hypothetical protein ACWA44_09335 [Thiotrichales bacterium]
MDTNWIELFAENVIYDIVKFTLGYFLGRYLYEGVYKRWRYGGWSLSIYKGEEKLVQREISAPLAEKLLDLNELSVYIKGVVSPYTRLNTDIASKEATDSGLMVIDRKQRQYVVNIANNPPKHSYNGGLLE